MPNAFGRYVTCSRDFFQSSSITASKRNKLSSKEDAQNKGASQPNRDHKGAVGDDIDDDATDVAYDDYDWDELPDEGTLLAHVVSFKAHLSPRQLSVREAASSLGYTQSDWDNDREIPEMDVSWRNLTKEQRRAAETLGYCQSTWD